jgi:glycosyltransferase involved in cell wall biosynthesis
MTDAILTVSIIVTTYERPDALDRVLDSLSRLDTKPAEVLIADDGSKASTAECIRRWQEKFPCPLVHVWQADEGFRAAAARNRAVAQASGDYLVFLDGDCLVFADFARQHMSLAEPGKFVVGNRVLLNPELTLATLAGVERPTGWSARAWIGARLSGRVNRVIPLLRLPADARWRHRRPGEWRGARTCNLALWRKDFMAVNGFDETYQGWGHEDADLVARLIRHGVRRKDGHFAVPVLHLWHRENPRGTEAENFARLQQVLRGERDVVAARGVDQYPARAT